MTNSVEELDLNEPEERRFSARLSLLIIILLNGAAWWLLLPVLSFLFSVLGPYAITACVVFGLVRLGLPVLEKSSKGLVLGHYYLTD